MLAFWADLNERFRMNPNGGTESAGWWHGGSEHGSVLKWTCADGPRFEC